MKSVLLISPRWMDIYQDIVDALKYKGFYVDYIEEVSNQRDPNNVRGKKQYSHRTYSEKLKQYWIKILNSKPYNRAYDILFVIDGQGVHPVLFDILTRRNDKLLKVNYLFDTVAGVYHFEKNFIYFDRIYTFDIKESKKFGISFMPIYWKQEISTDVDYKFFGFGSYIKQRFDLFRKIEVFANMHQMNSFIKVLVKNRYPNWIYDVRRYIRRLFDLYDDYPSFLYNSTLAYEHTMTPSQFRDYINKSEIIIDTCPLHQDGLTARFMWALGAGKKIITTNESVKTYSFYSDSFIFLVNMDESFIDNKKFYEFVNSNYIESKEVREKINEYRLDNWLRILIGI